MLDSLIGITNHLSIWTKTVKVWGSQMHATSLDRLIYLLLHKFSFMGVAERRFFEAHVKPGMTVVDIGANLGLYTMLFSQLVGAAGRVIAFEPEPTLFEALSRNCAGICNVTLFNMAVGARSERRIFCPGTLNSGDNRLAVSEPSGSKERLWVDVVRLSEVSDGHVDFVKIDVQGFEMEVFQGMESMWSADIRIYFEYWPYGLRLAGKSPEELLRFLESHGFRVCLIEAGRVGDLATDTVLSRRVRGRSYINLYAEHKSAQQQSIVERV